jgi:hypothetical protein
MKKHSWKIIIGILVLLSITNPNQSDFDRFSGCNSNYSSEKCGRQSYLLLFSIYHIKDSVEIFAWNKQSKETVLSGINVYDKYYIGIFKNFINYRTLYSYSSRN